MSLRTEAAAAPTQTEQRKIPARFIYFFGSFGGILFGYDIGVMTGALPFLTKDWGLTGNAAAIGWITSSLMLGAIFGGAMSGQLADKLGRRRSILVAAIIFAVASLALGVSPHGSLAYMIVMRVVLGLAVGAASALVPAYMAEMAPAGVRGRLSGLNQTMIVSGMLLSYIVAWFLQHLPTTWAWRSMLAVAAIPAVILFLGVLKLPESPRFLVRNGQEGMARAVLGMIRKPEQVEPELREIQQAIEAETNAQQSTSWATLLNPRYRYLLIAGVGVAAFQQFQGANAIFYYIPLIVEQASGKEASSALMWPIIQGVILVLGSLLFMAIADRFNRRTLLTLGGSVMGISFILPAVIAKIAPDANPMLIVVFLSIYVAFYSFTWAPLTWVLVGEVFPLVIRGRAAGMASSFNWIGSFAVGLLFPIMTAHMPQAAVFAIFGAICIAGVLFVRTCVPETKGRSLEEIEAAGSR
ncbi:sugar porter (SP) family MFS transporter [Luteococcus japonicus]|uniref:Sugar porter (SP) family MFS transporter n=1 Tax=Luteococcus japonicus TaxID=33984 RepID=A0A3N1ZW43_9ACTN|nr:sugar porter family MFS transporter [Luteococcus japonicus]ROR55074.1 sugar porter (SP) family MFS transporter [Luteococcus japonicus]